MNQITKTVKAVAAMSAIALVMANGLVFAQAGKKSKNKPVAEAAKPAEPVAAAPAKSEPAAASVAATNSDPVLAEDPSVTNEKGVFPNGYANRPSKPDEEKLTIIGRIQMRAMSGQQDTMWSRPETDYGLVDFNFRRLRLGAMYEGSKHWGMIVHLRAENMLVAQTTKGLIQEAGLWWNFDFMRSRITAGMINQPFAREYQISSANLAVVERSMVIDALQQFDNGVMINFNPLKEIDKNLDRFMTIYAMVGTGNGGAGDFGTGRRVDANSTTGAGVASSSSTGSTFVPASPSFYGRININPLGGFHRGNKDVGWVEGEEMFVRETKLSLGAGFAGTRETHIANIFRPEFDARSTNTYTTIGVPLTLASNPGGSTSGKFCPTQVQCDLFAQTYDIKGVWKGLYFDGAFTYIGGNAGQNITGVTASLGYNFHITGGTWIMPIIRYDFMKGNFGTNTGHANMGSGLSSDPANQITMLWAGVNLYVDKNLNKIQIFYAKNMNNYKGYDASGSAFGGYKQDLIIVQGQVSFWTGANIADKPEALGH